MNPVENLRKAVKENKVVCGQSRTEKEMVSKKVKEIFIAANTPKSIESRVNKLAEIAKVKVHKVEQKNDELGAICKKPFSVSIASILK